MWIILFCCLKMFDVIKVYNVNDIKEINVINIKKILIFVLVFSLIWYGWFIIVYNFKLKGKCLML